MFKLKENWQAMALVAVVSIVAVLFVERLVWAAWQDPTEEPGGAAVGGIVTTPLYEDLDLGGYDIVDSKILENPEKRGTVESTAYCCGLNYAAFYGVTNNGSGFAFYGSTTAADGPVAYFKGNVGIGDASSATHLLDIKSVAGWENAELTLQSGANGYWGIYNNETDDELRFWNATVPGDQHALILNNNGDVEIPNGYLQIDSTGSIPGGTACTAAYYGRMILNTANNRLYICSTNLLGPAWRYATLN